MNDGTLVYRVFPQGNVVKADVVNSHLDAVSICNKLIESADLKVCDVHLSSPDMLMEFSYGGRARANTKDGDIFDENTGKDIARKKALDKYHRAYDSRLCLLLNDLRSLVATVEYYCEKKKIDTSSVDTVDGMKQKRFYTPPKRGNN